MGGTLGKMGVGRRNERSAAAIGHYSQRLRLVEGGLRLERQCISVSEHN